MCLKVLAFNKLRYPAARPCPNATRHATSRTLERGLTDRGVCSHALRRVPNTIARETTCAVKEGTQLAPIADELLEAVGEPPEAPAAARLCWMSSESTPSGGSGGMGVPAGHRERRSRPSSPSLRVSARTSESPEHHACASLDLVYLGALLFGF